MKRLGLALAAAAALTALTAAPSAWAQRAKQPDAPAEAAPAKAGEAPKITAADKARGAKEAPALVAASDARSCQVSDSAFRGSGTSKGADGKPGKVTIYEVACQSGPGYLIIAGEGAAKPQAVNCIAASQGATHCALPPNLDPKVELAGYVTQTGRTCDVSQARWVGSSPSGATYYEVGCANSAGFVISTSATEPAKAVDCLQTAGTALACEYTTKPQMLAAYQPFVQKAGRTCQISDVRILGASKETGDTFTELACGSAPGFMLVQDRAGAFKSAIDCGKAGSIAGGCTLTDTTVAQTADAATYSKLAAKAGFPCQVTKYRFIGTDATNREVVELACGDHPEGALAAFSETGKSDIYDCVRAPALGGQSCKLTEASIVYPKYTAALATKGRNTCKVSGAGYLGATQQGVEYVETACADGNPGWVIGFQKGTNTAADLMTCTQAKNAGLPCKLPTNTGGKG